MKVKHLLLLAGLGLAGYFVYNWYQKRKLTKVVEKAATEQTEEKK